MFTKLKCRQDKLEKLKANAHYVTHSRQIPEKVFSRSELVNLKAHYGKLQKHFETEYDCVEMLFLKDDI